MITKNINGNNISQEFIDEIRSDSPNTTARLMLKGQEISCDIVNITVKKGSCGTPTFMLGCVVADILTATVKNLNVALKNKEIEYQVGALVGEEYEYISLGKFIVSEVKKTRYQQKITAYSNIVGKTGDVLSKFATDPPTLGAIAAKVAGCVNCDVYFDEGIDNTLRIATAFDAGSTVYNALEVLALCCGGYAINDTNGDIHIKKFGMNTDLNVDTGMMTKLPEISEDSYFVEYDEEEEVYVVEGPRIERMLGYTNIDSEKGFEFFQKFLKNNGILDELEALGIKDGDTVRMYGLEFDYYK